MLEGMKPPLNRIYYCRVEQVLKTLDEQNQLILIEALNDLDSWPARTLSNELRKRGLSLADTTISKHRQLSCQCGRGS